MKGDTHICERSVQIASGSPTHQNKHTTKTLISPEITQEKFQTERFFLRKLKDRWQIKIGVVVENYNLNCCGLIMEQWRIRDFMGKITTRRKKGWKSGRWQPNDWSMMVKASRKWVLLPLHGTRINVMADIYLPKGSIKLYVQGSLCPPLGWGNCLAVYRITASLFRVEREEHWTRFAKPHS